MNLGQGKESVWNSVPDLILLQIFKYLSPKQLLKAGLVCKSWSRVSYDKIVWKKLFYRSIKVDASVSICPGKESWYNEYKRLSYEVPTVCTDVLKAHSDQVLHVSCSHDGTMFATSSKDGYINVWNVGEVITYKYGRDMKSFSWNYTQFSEFNRSDTLLLVSGVHFGFTHSTSGEIAVFSLIGGFELQCRVGNKPYDIFGTWISDRYLLSGDLHCISSLISTTGLWISKASQEIESEQTPIMSLLYRFHNVNASSVRKVMVAECVDCEDQNSTLDKRKNGSNEDIASSSERFDETDRACLPDDSSDNSEMSEDDDLSNEPEKLLIFITGSKTYTPHKVGLKRVKNVVFPKKIMPVAIEELEWLMVHRSIAPVGRAEKFDKADAYIDLNGHIIGAALSPDHRYLFVNCRSWPEGCRITNPLQPPPISSQIDLHVIDLKTFELIGKPFTSHRAYTCSTECFFIFLDVSQDYVASGAEDKFGYLWDRHYGTCLAKYPHGDVVNSVSFSPTDPNILITVSDDYTVKVWRSRKYIQLATANYTPIEYATSYVPL